MRYKLALLFVLVLTCSVGSAMQGSKRSVWSGVFTAAQAERGKQEYQKSCIRCHAANLDGVQDANLLGDFAPRFSLRGTDFMERWREDTAQSLFDLVKKGMPPRNEPKAPRIVELSDQTYLDLVAYLLQGNGFPAGDTELGSNNLRNIRIQEQNGPRPLPSFSIVQAVGCFTQHTPGAWELSQAPEPIRIRELTKPT